MKDLKKGQYVIIKEYMPVNDEERRINACWLLRFQETKEIVTAYIYRFTVIDCYVYDCIKNEFYVGNRNDYNKYWSMFIKSIKDKYLNDEKILKRYYYYLPISNIPKYFNYNWFDNVHTFELVSAFPIETNPKEAKLIWKLFESELKEERKC